MAGTSSQATPADSWFNCDFTPLTAGPVEGRLTLPAGRAAGPGDLGVFADAGLGRAVLAHLGRRSNIRTVNLRLDFTERCPSPAGLVLTAEAEGAGGSIWRMAKSAPSQASSSRGAVASSLCCRASHLRQTIRLA